MASRDVLITGGADFLGAHLGSHLLATSDARVTLVDDLVDPGALWNVEWLKSQAGDGRLTLVRGRSRNTLRLADAASSAGEIYFLADPCGAEDNGVMESAWIVLEAARRSGRNPALICALATGSLGGQNVAEDSAVARFVQDFACSHQLPAVFLRMDTVTGPRQFHDALDWVARAEYAILSGRRCRVAADAMERHDVLHVADAVHAILAARAYIGNTAGKRYCLRGGQAHEVTVTEMVQLIERVSHRHAQVDAPWSKRGRPAPTPVADPSFLIDTAWMPRRSLEETVREIAAFWHANRDLIAIMPQAETSFAQMSTDRPAPEKAVPGKAA
jgi:nucleoside-diphosphate-sugar epimerase